MKVISRVAALAVPLLIGIAPASYSLAASPAGYADDKVAAATGQYDQQIQTDLQKSFDKKNYKGIQAAVHNGIVKLTGSVELYQYKEEADRKAHHTKNVLAVENDVLVSSGKEVSDAELQQKIGQKIAYDRVGYGDQAFNAITVGVQNGVVTLGGHAYGYPSRNDAVAIASNYPGVQDVVDEIQVDPTSPFDDQTRIAVARAIYGYPSLNKYAIDPARPIRISVQNGQVSLYGTVDTQADKDTANIRANGVANVFKVNNYLQVAGQTQERSRK